MSMLPRNPLDAGLIPGGGRSPVADALDAIRRAATQPSPGTAGGNAFLPQLPAIFPLIPDAAEEEAPLEAGLTLFSIHAGDAWIRTGPPAFSVVQENGHNTLIPRHTRVRVTEENGDYRLVESVDGQYSVWTHAGNLTSYYRENEPMQSAALAPGAALPTASLGGNPLAASRLYNRTGGLMRVCAEALCEEVPGNDGEDRINHVIAFALAVFLKEVGGAPHTPGSAIIRIEPHRIRDDMLETAAQRETFARYFFRNDSNSWRFSEAGDDESVPLYPASAGGVTGEYFQARQNRAVTVAREVLTELELDPDRVLHGVSIGGPQILVADIEYNLHCGYDSASAMWEAFQGPDERAHVLGYFDFIRNKQHPASRRRIHHYMLESNFRAFGRAYNGAPTVYGDELEVIYDEVLPLLE